MQPHDFIKKGQEHKVSKLKKCIYGLKHTYRSGNITFDQTNKTYGFDQSLDESYIYKHIKDDKAIFFVLYVDDILFIRNDAGVFTSDKTVLHNIRHEGPG